MPTYGLRLHRLVGTHEVIERVVKASTTITAGDPVSLDTNNKLIVTTVGLPILGVAQQTVVQGSGTTLTCEVLCGHDNVWALDNDNIGTTFAAANAGAGNFFDLIGTTGAVLCDTSTLATAAGTKSFSCIDQAPDPTFPGVVTGTTGLFKINPANSQY